MPDIGKIRAAVVRAKEEMAVGQQVDRVRFGELDYRAALVDNVCRVADKDLW